MSLSLLTNNDSELVTCKTNKKLTLFLRKKLIKKTTEPEVIVFSFKKFDFAQNCFDDFVSHNSYEKVKVNARIMRRAWDFDYRRLRLPSALRTGPG